MIKKYHIIREKYHLKKFQGPLIKILSKLEISSEFDKENLNANKKLIANILFNDERLKTFCFED